MAVVEERMASSRLCALLSDSRLGLLVRILHTMIMEYGWLHSLPSHTPKVGKHDLAPPLRCGGWGEHIELAIADMPAMRFGRRSRVRYYDYEVALALQA